MTPLVGVVASNPKLLAKLGLNVHEELIGLKMHDS
jgi:hypothetical protein